MTKQQEFEFEIKKDFLALPAKELLEEYGSGSHIPGSGSAAALSGLIAIEMMRTVCKLTLKKPRYEQYHRQFEFILNRLEKEFKPKLMDLFKQDIEIFNLVSVFRIKRDSSQDGKQRNLHNRSALKEQKKATDIPLRICQLCLEMLPLAPRFLIMDSKLHVAIRV